MRLVNTDSLKLQDFFEGEIPDYAILSHRWEGSETNFQDYRKGRNKKTAGYKKVVRFCEIAKARGHKWVWVDTCCIDKKSSAELSEAVNSMYQWYKNAGVCFAYLSDVTYVDEHLNDPVLTGFETSQWFARGWTLQELLAPVDVDFFDSKWKFFGRRSIMAGSISNITGIAREYLVSSFEPRHVFAAEKLSWASGRSTSRVEDAAYSLMGLLDINMPLLYGERNKAFLRLQQEYIRVTDDMSMFAWGHTGPGPAGIFAPSPAQFSSSAGIEPLSASSLRRFKLEELFKYFPLSYATTNKGLQIHGFLTKDLLVPHKSVLIRRLILSCGKVVVSTGGTAATIGEKSSVSVCVLQIIAPVETKDESGNIITGSHWQRVMGPIQFIDADELLRHSTRLQEATFYLEL